MTIVIKVENLGKKYTLRHQSGQQPYVALRDVITERAAAIGRKLLHPFSSSPLTSHDSQEEFWALKDVSFEVKQGDRIGIIGRNGAGKSTLLKILSRITEPTTGSVRIKGRVASLLEVGTGFHPELTGRENIYLNGAILGMHRAEIKKKFDEIVDFAEIEKFLDTPVKRYSSGMYVRLAFAVAAHLEPEILVVDEVLAVGDAQFQKKCLGKMEDVSAKEGRTVLFVSHNMAAVGQLCDRGLWLEHGTMKSIGIVSKVVDEYLADGDTAAGVRIWSGSKSAPGNERISLLVVRVRDHLDEVSAQLDMEHSFSVELEYQIHVPQAKLRTGFWIYTAEGVLVFVAGDNEDPAWRGVKRPAGRYLSRCRIPAKLLNSGRYFVTVAADIQGSELLFLQHNVLNFQIEQTGPTVLDGAQRSPGIVRPSLEWCVERVGER
jgi:lipopolysaccharide transport system ATP-binding protein